jgi:glutathione peroxidase
MGLFSFLAEKFSPRRALQKTTTSIYDFKIPSLNGEVIDLSQYRGKPLLIVNTASRCGFTHQYEDLQKLHEQFGDSVHILGFPANNFMWQEPGSDNEIASFCRMNYGVTFPMFTKISVKGNDKHPLYQWLQAKTGREPSWNFCKYLVSGDDDVKFFTSKVSPLDKQITDRIKASKE